MLFSLVVTVSDSFIFIVSMNINHSFPLGNIDTLSDLSDETLQCDPVLYNIINRMGLPFTISQFNYVWRLEIKKKVSHKNLVPRPCVSSRACFYELNAYLFNR